MYAAYIAHKSVCIPIIPVNTTYNKANIWHHGSHMQFQYKAAIQLYKLYNVTKPSLDWVTLNLNQTLTTRQTKFLIAKSNNNKVGLNQTWFKHPSKSTIDTEWHYPPIMAQLHHRDLQSSH